MIVKTDFTRVSDKEWVLQPLYDTSVIHKCLTYSCAACRLRLMSMSNNLGVVIIVEGNDDMTWIQQRD